MESNLHLDLPVPAARALAAVTEAAELWDGAWEPHARGGRLLLPLTAGVRRGILDAQVTARGTADGSRLELQITGTDYRVNWSAVAILVLGAGGGLLMIAWPLFPDLLQLMPVGVVMAFLAWLLVASRLRMTDPADFLKLVQDLADQDEIVEEHSDEHGESERRRDAEEPPRAIEP